jgi:hypothetical protein
MKFIHEAGIPQKLVSDGSKEQMESDFAETSRVHHIKREITVPHSPWQNLAEASIRQLKQGTRAAMRRTRTPKRLWCYCIQWIAAIRRLTSMDKLDDRTLMEATFGSTPDISQFAQFDWYEPVTYLERNSSFPKPRIKYGRWLGVYEDATSLMSFLVLTDTGIVIVRKDVWAISRENMGTDQTKLGLADLDAKILEKIGDHLKDSEVTFTVDGEPMTTMDTIFDDEDDALDEAEEPEAQQLHAEDVSESDFDQYINAEFVLTNNGEATKAVVVARRRDKDFVPVGKRNSNPLLDTREYEVQLSDGTRQCVTANLIAESILSQVDDEGNSFAIIKDIVDHRKDESAVDKENGVTIGKGGKEHPKITTKGWALEVEWRDGTSSWIELKDLKASNPVMVAEYAIANKISEEPAFKWWVRDVLKRRDRCILKVETRKLFKPNMKYGVQIPRTMKEALEIDRRTGTKFWENAAKKEMGVVAPAFEFTEDGIEPEGWLIVCHIIFDVKNGPHSESPLRGGRTYDRSPEVNNLLKRCVT